MPDILLWDDGFEDKIEDELRKMGREWSAGVSDTLKELQRIITELAKENRELRKELRKLKPVPHWSVDWPIGEPTYDTMMECPPNLEIFETH